MQKRVWEKLKRGRMEKDIGKDEPKMSQLIQRAMGCMEWKHVRYLKKID